MASKNGRDTFKTLEKRNKNLASINLLKFLVTIIIIITSVKSAYQSSNKC